jgi:alanyl-tRNA synthetase
VEAVTGDGALAYVQQQEAQLQQVADAVKAQPQEAAARITQILDNVKVLEKEVTELKLKLASSQFEELVKKIENNRKTAMIGDTLVWADELENANSQMQREMLDRLKSKYKSVAIVLSSVDHGKVSMIAGVTPDIVTKVNSGQLVNFVAQQVGGKGGGRPDMAMAGGTQPEHLARALNSVPAWVKKKLVPELLD